MTARYWVRAELEAIRPGFARDPYDGEVMRECSVTSVRVERGRAEVLRIAEARFLGA